MVLSLNANKKKILCLLLVIAIIVAGALIIPKMVKEPITYYGETNEQRVNFIASYGYTVNPEPIDCRTVTIPKEFNDIYGKYNEMQKAQGFDLKPHRGKECTQYIYLIENYPGESREIHATLLVRDGVIIGGDVCCAEVDGFMHGFALDSKHYDGGTSVEVTPVPPQSTDTEDTVESEAETGADFAEEIITENPEEVYPTD